MMKTLLLLAMSLGLAVAGPALADADSAPSQKPVFHAYKCTPPHCFTFVLPESEESKIALAKQAAWFSEHLGLD